MNTLRELIKKCSGQKSITLTGEETSAFYDMRGQWGNVVRITQRSGDVVQNEWDNLPRKTHTQENYFVGKTEVIPAFPYWGLGNTLRPRGEHDVD